jgi:hypothetical protein
VVETVRRLLLTAIVSVVSNGSTAQIVFGIFIAIAYMKLYAYFSPFLEGKDNMLQEMAQYQVFLTLFIALLLRDASLTGPAWTLGFDAVLVFCNSVTPAAAVTFIVQAKSKLLPVLAKQPPQQGHYAHVADGGSARSSGSDRDADAVHTPGLTEIVHSPAATSRGDLPHDDRFTFDRSRANSAAPSVREIDSESDDSCFRAHGPFIVKSPTWYSSY